MRSDARANEGDDKKKREEVELHNNADQLIHQTESQTKEFKDKLSDDDKTRLDEAIGKLKEANGGNDASAIQSAIDAVNKARRRDARHPGSEHRRPLHRG